MESDLSGAEMTLALIDDPTLNRIGMWVAITVGVIQLARWYYKASSRFKLTSVVLGLIGIIIGFVGWAFFWLYPTTFGEPFWMLGLRLSFTFGVITIVWLIIHVSDSVFSRIYLGQWDDVFHNALQDWREYRELQRQLEFEDRLKSAAGNMQSNEGRGDLERE